jgi:uncharacterized YigZ family protein
VKDQYLTLKAPAEGFFMEKGSKFYAYCFPVLTEAEVQLLLEKTKKEHPKARHFCTAWRLFPDTVLERSNDDGEPSGSAGKPILGQLIKHNLTNVMVVVVRYFGGTKLGIPGLIEAYKTSTAEAIANAGIVERNIYEKIRIDIPYDVFPPFLNFCKQNHVHLFEETYSDMVTLVIGLKKATSREDLKAALHQFSKMDFSSLEEFQEYLGYRIVFTGEEEIL